MKKNRMLAIAGLLLALADVSAFAAGNPKKGADLFVEECGDCHSPIPGKNKKGPSLNGVIGRPAGSIGDFADYSSAMRQAGFAWSPEKIDAYLAQPRKVIAGGKMKYDGLPDGTARADVIAYLQSLK